MSVRQFSHCEGKGGREREAEQLLLRSRHWRTHSALSATVEGTYWSRGGKLEILSFSSNLHYNTEHYNKISSFLPYTVFTLGWSVSPVVRVKAFNADGGVVIYYDINIPVSPLPVSHCISLTQSIILLWYKWLLMKYLTPWWQKSFVILYTVLSTTQGPLSDWN